MARGPGRAPALQEGVAFACRAGVAVAGVGGGVAREGALVVLEGLPGDEAGVRVGDEGDPFVAGDEFEALAAAGLVAGALPAVTEGAGVAGVVQDLQDAGVREREPAELALVAAAAVADREAEVLLAEALHDGAAAAVLGEGVEEEPDGALDGFVGVELDVVEGVVDEADREGDLEFAAAGFGELPADEARAEEVELGGAHGALEAEEELIVEVAGVVDAVFVGDRGVGEGAELDQAVPVGRVPGEPAHFEPEDDAGAAEADFGDELLKAFAIRGAGARLALIAVDGDDPLARPAECDGALLESVLTGGRLGVAHHLPQGGLADVDEGRALEVRTGDLAESAGTNSSARRRRTIAREGAVHAFALARGAPVRSPRSISASSATIASRSRAAPAAAPVALLVRPSRSASVGMVDGCRVAGLFTIASSLAAVCSLQTLIQPATPARAMRLRPQRHPCAPPASASPRRRS